MPPLDLWQHFTKWLLGLMLWIARFRVFEGILRGGFRVFFAGGFWSFWRGFWGGLPSLWTVSAMRRRLGGWMDGQMGDRTDWQIDEWMDGQMRERKDWHRDEWMEGHMGDTTDWLIDEWTDGQMGERTDWRGVDCRADSVKFEERKHHWL